MKIKNIYTLLGVGLLLVAITGCAKEEEKDIPVKITETRTTTTKEVEIKEKNSDSATESLQVSQEEEEKEFLKKIIGTWELKIYGQEGYELIVTEDQFQFFALYNGHVAPPNNQDITHEINLETKEITLTGTRQSSDILRGESLGNDLSRDVILLKFSEESGVPTLKVTVDGKLIQLSNQENLFSKLSNVAEIMEIEE